VASPYGIAAALTANVSHGQGHGLVGAAVAAWSAIALVGSYELIPRLGSTKSSSHATGSDAP
jgi:hypothetical protein